MNEPGSRLLTEFARIFFWCLFTLLQLIFALLATLAIVTFYAYLFVESESQFGRSGTPLRKNIDEFGFGGVTAIFIFSFVAIKILYWAIDRNESERRSIADTTKELDLKETYGDSATIQPVGNGYGTKVRINGKEFEGGHQMFGVRSSVAVVNTASAFVKFKISDIQLEMKIAQHAFWFTPRKEPLSIVPRDETRLLDTLTKRYDCYCSDRSVITAFIACEQVQRELLPRFPNSSERFTLTIRNGEVKLECTADTKSDRSIAEAATFALLKKLFARAEIFDRRLKEIGKA